MQVHAAEWIRTQLPGLQMFLTPKETSDLKVSIQF